MSEGNEVESSDGGEYDDGFGEVSFQVIDEAFIAAAEAAQIVWGKVGSYPHWPAQVLTPAEVAARPALTNSRPKSAAAPVLFFGEYTVSWMPRKSLLTWGEGIQRGCHLKMSPEFQVGVTEVAEFLNLQEPRIAPPHWWCAAPVVGTEASISVSLSTYFPSDPVKPVSGPSKPQQSKKAAAAAAAPAAASNGGDGGGGETTAARNRRERVRWSARDVLKPLVNRLKRLFPQLSDDATPTATQDLLDWVEGYFGNAIDINHLKEKTVADLVAEMFTRQTGQPFTADQISNCCCVTGLIDFTELQAMGISPREWDVPLVGGPKIKQPVKSRSVAKAAPSTGGAGGGVSAFAAVSGSGVSVPVTARMTDPSAPSLQVVNGRLIVPSRMKSNRVVTTSEMMMPVASGDGDSGNGNSIRAGLNDPPNYAHVKQNVWISRMRPKKFHKDEISVCSCPRPTAIPTPAQDNVEMAAAAAVEVKAEEQEMIDEEMVVVVQQIMQEIFAPYFDLSEPEPQPLLEPQQQQQQEVDAGKLICQRTLSRSRTASAGVSSAIAAARGPHRPTPPTTDPSQLNLPRDGCGEGCLNRLSFIHCDQKTCPAGERCSNRPFYQLDCPNVEVYLTKDKGWGVRANEYIPRGSFVVEYSGEVVDEHEMKARMEEAKQRQEPHFYMMEMAPGLIIDARPKGNIARLLNSSCDPNCETQKWHDAATGEIRVGIFTLRDVAPGEELVYDYHFQQLFGDEDENGEYVCRCGAAKCRGTMDATLDRAADCGRRIEVWWGGDEVFYPGTITSYSSVTGKHTVQYDDGEIEKLDLQIQKHQWIEATAVAAAAAAVDDVVVGGAAAAAAAAAANGVADGGGDVEMLPVRESDGASPPVGGDGDGAADGAVVVPLPAIAAIMQGTTLVPDQPDTALQTLGNQSPAVNGGVIVGGGGGGVGKKRRRLPAPLESQQNTNINDAAAAAVDDSVKDNDQDMVIVEDAVDAAAAMASLPEELRSFVEQLMPPTEITTTTTTTAAAAVDSSAAVAPLPPAQTDQPTTEQFSPFPVVHAVVAPVFVDAEQHGATVAACIEESTRRRSKAQQAQQQQHALKSVLHLIDESKEVSEGDAAERMNNWGDGSVAGGRSSSEEEIQTDIQTNTKARPLNNQSLKGKLEGLETEKTAIDPHSPAAAAASVQEQRGARRKYLDTHVLDAKGAVPVDNPGAQSVAGRLHGNGKGGGRPRKSGVNTAAAAAGGGGGSSINTNGGGSGDAGPASLSGRGRKRQRKVFGDDFIEDVSDQEAPRGKNSNGTEDAGGANAAAAMGKKQQQSSAAAAVVMNQNVGSGPAAAVEEKTTTISAAAASQPPPPPQMAAQHAQAPPSANGVNTVTVPPSAPASKISQTAIVNNNNNAAVAPVAAPQVAYRAPAPSGSGHRRTGPTPGSTGLPARTILVAKRLTNSDVSKGRILLPRAAVEANLSFAIGRAHSLTAKDHLSQSWEFTLQSWANGMESRRVYVLEHAGDYIRHHVLKLDDVIGISCTENGEFLVEYNTDEVCSAAETQQAARGQGAPPPPIMPLPQGNINPLIQHNSGRCTRSIYCQKPAGHPGFCQRTPGAGRGRRTGGAAASRPATAPATAAAAAAAPGSSNNNTATTGYARPKRRFSAEDVRVTSKRSRRPTAKATSTAYRLSTEEEDQSYSELESDDESDWEQEERMNRILSHSHLANAAAPSAAAAHTGNHHGNGDHHHQQHSQYHSHQHQHSQRMQQHNSSGGGDVSGGGGGGGSRGHPHPTTSGASHHDTPPPEMDPSGPPIFVMAPDMNAPPQMPPHLRSPLRPSMIARQTSVTSPSPSLPHAASLASNGSLPLPQPPLPAPQSVLPLQPGAALGGLAAPSVATAAAGGGVSKNGSILPGIAALSVPEPVIAPTLHVLGVDGAAAVGGGARAQGTINGKPPTTTTTNNTTAATLPTAVVPHVSHRLPPALSLQSHGSSSLMMSGHVPPLTVPLFGGPPPANAPIGMPTHVVTSPHPSEFDCMSFLNTNNNFIGGGASGGGGK